MTTVCGARRTMVTSLHIAAQARDSSVLEYLLAEGLQSNIDAQADTGITPLIAAVWAKRPRNVSLLLSNGANIGVIDVLGYTPIHLAAKHGHEEVVAIFIEHGSDLGLLDSVGLTPELVARKCGHTTLANVIKNYVNEQSAPRRWVPMKLCILTNSMCLQTINQMLSHIVRYKANLTDHWKHCRWP